MFEAEVRKVFRFILDHTFNSVIFGISLMVLIALYIAVGSGLASVREYFEMNEMQFFAAWPLKLLIFLLVLNLTVVTFKRIPLTPPRYGVWCVHLGIIILVTGMGVHYNLKVEGTTLVPLNRTVEHFYDAHERMLYMRVDGQPVGQVRLPSLPRFRAYDAELKNDGRLNRADLRGIVPFVRTRDPHLGNMRVTPLWRAAGLDDELHVNIVGYYPYADIVTDFIEDPSVDMTGVKVTANDPETGEPVESWLVSADRRARRLTIGSRELIHLHVETDEEVEEIKASATRLHRLDVTLAGYTDSIFVEPGRSYRLGQTGYLLEVEDYIPAFPMFGTGELVKVLTLKVTTPTQTFRRQVLADKPATLQTDFSLDVPGAPPFGQEELLDTDQNVPGAQPFGQRQEELLDTDLTILYTVDDDYHLPPHEQRERHTLLTSAESDHVTQIITSTERPAQVSDDGPLPVRRSDHLRMEQRIVEVPASERTRDMGEMGVFQVIKAEVTSGTWSQTVAVPFSQYAYSMGWDGGYVTLPGTNTTLQLQLGKTLHPMPVRVTLEEFELVPYPGGDINVGIPRDFKSTLIIEERGGGGQPYTDVAHMNSPVYVSDQYGHSWLLFQAAWDPEGQAWTVLGVGNRPAVGIMTLGGTMILVGLLYAFYVKPIIIRKMKESALRQAAERNASSRAAPARQPAEQPLPAPMMSARTSEPT